MHDDISLRRRQFCISTMAAAVALPTVSRSQSSLTKVRFQLDWRFEAGVAAHVVALRKGYFAQEGLDVTLNVGSGASATVTRLASGTADIGTGDMSSLAEFAANNPNLPAQAVMMVYDQTPACVISLKKSGIRQPGDLRGRQLAAPVNDGARKIFPLFAARNGLDPAKDVSWLSVEPSLRETMLARGQVEAITGYVASGLITLQKLGIARDDVEVTRYSDHGVDLYGNAIMASSAFIREQPKALEALLRAVTRAYKDVNSDRSGAIALLKEQDPLSDVRIENMRLAIIMNDEIKTASVQRDGFGGIDIARYQRGIDELSGALNFRTTPRADALVNRSFLPPVADRKFFFG